MERIRSPNYPAIGLPEAIRRLEKLFTRAQHRSLSREQAVEAMGYDGLHGSSLGAISALLKFGLLTKQNGQVLVSKRGMAIIAPEDDREKREAIAAAVQAFPLFKELHDRFLGVVPSDDKLRSFLLRKSFSSRALEKVLRAYRETIELVSDLTGEYDAPPLEEDVPAKMAHQISSVENVHPARSPPTVARGVPFRVAVEGDTIEVSGRLTTPEQVEKLVKILELNKVMITPVDGGFDTECTDDEEGRKTKEQDRKLDEEFNKG